MWRARRHSRAGENPGAHASVHGRGGMIALARNVWIPACAGMTNCAIGGVFCDTLQALFLHKPKEE